MLDEDVLWRAVATRNRGWDGMFVYAVESTGIYCRCTCPSRRPRRERTRFFARGSDARAAGFRPCRRCDPDAPPEAAAAIERVRQACATIARRNGAGVSLRLLALAAGVSEHQLLRSFKRALGITPREYAEACRSGCLRTALRQGRGVADAAFAAGYGSGSRVYERAHATLGMTPARYAAGAGGETVNYAITKSCIGHVLVAVTPRGVCSVSIGSDPATLERELRREFPGATVGAGNRLLADAVAAVIGSLERDAPDPRLPLDVRATAFQRRVWQELQQIPRGQTRSYQEVAKRLARPTATRAVARACATNPVALLVPCHRVVRTDGGHGGYRWGVGRKRALLERERS